MRDGLLRARAFARMNEDRPPCRGLIPRHYRLEARLRRQEVVKIITLSADIAVDGAIGDETVFINHSCAPPASMRIVPGEHVAFFALRDINPAQEIAIEEQRRIARKQISLPTRKHNLADVGAAVCAHGKGERYIGVPCLKIWCKSATA